MNMRTIKLWAASVAVFTLALGVLASAHAQQSQQPVPDAYYQLLGRANYAFQHANNKDDYAAAAKLFQQAVDAASWLPDTYYDLGKAQEKAEQFNDAISSFQQYLNLKPDASDRDKVNAEIEELQGEAQQSTVQPPAEQQSPQTQSDAEFIQGLNGARYRHSDIVSQGDSHQDLTIEGDQLLEEDYMTGVRGENVGAVDDRHYDYQIQGRTASTIPQWSNTADEENLPYCTIIYGNADCKYVFIIHPDYIESTTYVGGTRLTDNFIKPNGERYCCDHVFKRVQ